MFKSPSIPDARAAIAEDRGLDYLGTRSPAVDLDVICRHAAEFEPGLPQARATEDNIEKLFDLARRDLEGNKRTRMNNHISRARTALRKIGIPLKDGYGCGEISPTWLALLEKLKKGSAGRNRFFASYCTERGIEPAGVTQSVLDQYEPLHMADRNFKSGRQTWIAFVNAWAEEVVPLIGPDAQEVRSPFKPRTWYRIERDEWTPEFLADVTKMAAMLVTQRSDRRGPRT